jgi:hypothetical protein
MSEKTDARELQRYTGAAYTTCLRWVRILRAEDWIKPELTPTAQDKTLDRKKALRVALHKRFPEARIERDEDT